MKEKERHIISHLRKDSRTSLARISEDTNIPISTIHDKIKKMERQKLIRHTTIVDFTQFGYHHQSTLAIKIQPSQRDDFLSFLHTQDNINTISEINGGFDFMIETISPSIKEHMAFLDKIDDCFTIIQIHEFQIIQKLQQEKFTPYLN